MALDYYAALSSYTTKELKNHAMLSLKQYYLHYYVVLSNVTYNCSFCSFRDLFFPTVKTCSFLLRYVCV